MTSEYISREAAIKGYLELLKMPGEIFVTEVTDLLQTLPAADVRENKRGKWINHGKFMAINLENAREQYSVLGYPHRNISREECSVCRKWTMRDDSVKYYDFCPHCGAEMEAGE